MTDPIILNQIRNRVDVITPGPQGPSGRTILNGNGAPAENLGVQGDFYYDKSTRRFYGPKLVDTSWASAENFILNSQSGTAATLGFVYTWDIVQLTGPVSGLYSILVTHNLGFFPNATVKDSGGNELELGIHYNNSNQITLTMAQPFGGTVYLS